MNFEQVHHLQNMANYLVANNGYNTDLTQNYWFWILFVVIEFNFSQKTLGC